jgi:regulator of replication initiation timing
MIKKKNYGIQCYLLYRNISKHLVCLLFCFCLKTLLKKSNVLNKRSQLIDENDALRLQNKELRILLTQYMQSPVNQELEIPPTKILQMEYSQ